MKRSQSTGPLSQGLGVRESMTHTFSLGPLPGCRGNWGEERSRDAMGNVTVPASIGAKRWFVEGRPLGLPQSPGHAPTSPFGAGIPGGGSLARLLRLHPWFRLGLLAYDLINLIDGY